MYLRKALEDYLFGYTSDRKKFTTCELPTFFLNSVYRVREHITVGKLLTRLGLDGTDPDLPVDDPFSLVKF